jgi:hypothetical protein
MTRSRLILLDANVVIALFEFGIWERVAARCGIVLARTVMDEAQFFDVDGVRQHIDWPRWTESGVVDVRVASATDVASFCRRFDPTYYEKLDPGEAESLVIMGSESDARICSADRIVWRVLGNTNQVDRGISLEEVLRQSGLTRSIPERFSRRFREHWCRIGFEERLMGRGDRGP